MTDTQASVAGPSRQRGGCAVVSTTPFGYSLDEKSLKDVDWVTSYDPPYKIVLTCAQFTSTRSWAGLVDGDVLDFVMRLVIGSVLGAEAAAQCFVFDTLFITDLLKLKNQNRDLRVHKRAPVNLFDVLYLIIPVYARTHWRLLVVVRAGLETGSFMVWFDSENNTEIDNDVTAIVREFLSVAWSLADRPFPKEFADDLVEYTPLLPQQPTILHGDEPRVPSNDPNLCGFYVLEFLKLFLEDPPNIIARIFANDLGEWFSISDMHFTRERTVELLLENMSDIPLKETLKEIIKRDAREQIDRLKKRILSDMIEIADDEIEVGYDSDNYEPPGRRKQARYHEPDPEPGNQYQVFSFHKIGTRKPYLNKVLVEWYGYRKKDWIPIRSFRKDGLWFLFEMWNKRENKQECNRPTRYDLSTGAPKRVANVADVIPRVTRSLTARNVYDSVVNRVVETFLSRGVYTREGGFLGDDILYGTLELENEFISQVFDGFKQFPSSRFKLFGRPVGNHIRKRHRLSVLKERGIFNMDYNTIAASTASTEMYKGLNKPILFLLMSPTGIDGHIHVYVGCAGRDESNKSYFWLHDPTTVDQGGTCFCKHVLKVAKCLHVGKNVIRRSFGTQSSGSDCLERSFIKIANLLAGIEELD